MKKRNGFAVMSGLIGLMKSMWPIMGFSIFMGTLGHFMATFITIFGVMALVTVLFTETPLFLPLQALLSLMIAAGILRGFVRYAEQAGNHYIAFKVLAIIRQKVFHKLRILSPAKLDQKNKGNLIALITSDVELLEVFYAHTISPIAIALLHSIILLGFFNHFHISLALFAGFCYFVLGIVFPIYNSKKGQKLGQTYRASYSELNSVVLDNLYGIDEIKQFQQTTQRKEKAKQQMKQMEELSVTLKKYENKQTILTDIWILGSDVLMLCLLAFLYQKNILPVSHVIIVMTAMMSSFGPVVALSALSSTLNQTFASGNRILDLLEEEPLLQENLKGVAFEAGEIAFHEVSFRYPDSQVDILTKESFQFQKHQIHGILGRSGMGKSTILKLLMRFYDPESGIVQYGNTNVSKIVTKELRKNVAYMTQDTFLFQDTILQNIKIANQDASEEQVIEAAKKASIHDFISSLPEGYHTKVGELGDTLSGGERQRIGLARIFLHESDYIYLDEPTSNIDSLNEAIILKSLFEARENKTILLVSHRKSTMAIADSMITKN